MPGHLAHSPADIIRWLLISLGQGTDPEDGSAWPIFAAGEPPAPDNSITIFDTVGRPEGRIMLNGERQEKPGIQVRVRATSSPVGFRKCQMIGVVLDEGVVLNQVDIPSETGTATYSYLVHAVTRTGNVMALGKETTSKRFVYVFNAVVAVQPCVPCP